MPRPYSRAHGSVARTRVDDPAADRGLPRHEGQQHQPRGHAGGKTPTLFQYNVSFLEKASKTPGTGWYVGHRR